MKKLYKFIREELGRMYAEAEADDLAYDDAFNTDRHYEVNRQTLKRDYRSVELLEDVIWTAYTLPKPYRKAMLKRIAALFEDSPNYKEKWRP